jgi:hypothetical protein
LLTLGGMLEGLNLDRARCLATRDSSGAGLDASFVEMEQAFVESVLQGWARESKPGYRQLIAELDRLLRAVTEGFRPLKCSGDVLRYMRVLRSVRVASGRAPSFAVCADRVHIGNALIEDVRQSL